MYIHQKSFLLCRHDSTLADRGVFCRVGVGFTRVVHNMCGHPLWGDISWYGDLLSSERNLEDRKRWSTFLKIKKPTSVLFVYLLTLMFLTNILLKSTLWPQHDHDVTVSSYQNHLERIHHLIGSWYIPHQETPHWPATLLVMSSPLWLYGKIKEKKHFNSNLRLHSSFTDNESQDGQVVWCV